MHHYTYRRAYTGPLQAAILDWAGTTIDYGSRAPLAVFLDVFAAHGVPVTLDEARGPMGMYKRDHIATMLHMPAVAQSWQQAHGRPPDEADVQKLYDDLIPRQTAIIAQYADLIPGVGETIARYRERGLKIGSCTGYTRAMMDAVLPEAARQGYAPDALVCPDDVPAGRPAPWMCFQNALRLGVYPMEALVKIGDTVVDVEEGLNAGMWTIGLAKTGNEVGLGEADLVALPPAEREGLLRAAYRKLYAAGAHYVVDSLADTLPVLDHIEQRLARGERP